MNKFLSKPDRRELLRQHKLEKDKHFADRIKTILLLDEGYSYRQISSVLFLDDSTIRRYEKNYLKGGLECLLTDNYKGGFGFLTSKQEAELKKHLTENVYISCKDIAAYIKKNYGVEYSEGGVLHLMNRLGFVYKKPKHVPGKADPKEQKKFVKKYEKILKNKGENDPVYFLDATHPHHNSIPSYGWILKGKEKQIRANTGRARVNINGAIDTNTMDVIVQMDERVNADSTIELLEKIEISNPGADIIYAIADNARYYRSRLVKEFLKKSKIKLLFLPAYSPNLNLIERLWKFFKKKVLYNTYYETFDIFKKACIDFFKNIEIHENELRTLLTNNFQIIGN